MTMSAQHRDNNGGGGERRGVPWRILGWSTVVFLLLLPLVAMRFTDEVNWTPFDFAFAAGMLGTLGLGLELVFRSRSNAFRLGAAVALGAAFLIVWSTGAVGVIGSEANPANLLYAAVLAVALLGALVARLRAAGMAWAMAAAGLATVAVLPAAAVIWPMTSAEVWSVDALGATAMFTAMWLVAAGLFHTAAKRG
jgi:hypothetical protein